MDTRALYAALLLATGGVCFATPNPEKMKFVMEFETVNSDQGPVAKLVGVEVQHDDQNVRSLAEKMTILKEKAKLRAADFNNVAASSDVRPSILSSLRNNSLGSIPKLGSNLKVPSLYQSETDQDGVVRIPSLRERLATMKEKSGQVISQAPIIDPAYNYDDITEPTRKPTLVDRASAVAKQLVGNYRRSNDYDEPSSSNVEPSILKKIVSPLLNGESLISRLESLRRPLSSNPGKVSQDKEASSSNVVSSTASPASRNLLPRTLTPPIKAPLNIRGDTLELPLRLPRLELPTPANAVAAPNIAPPIVSNPLTNGNLAPRLEELRNNLKSKAESLLRAKQDSEALPSNDKSSIIKSSTKSLEVLNSNIHALNNKKSLEEMNSKLDALTNKMHSMETALLGAPNNYAVSGSNNFPSVKKSPTLGSSITIPPLELITKENLESKLEALKSKFRNSDSGAQLLRSSPDNAASVFNDEPSIIRKLSKSAEEEKSKFEELKSKFRSKDSTKIPLLGASQVNVISSSNYKPSVIKNPFEIGQIVSSKLESLKNSKPLQLLQKDYLKSKLETLKDKFNNKKTASFSSPRTSQNIGAFASSNSPSIFAPGLDVLRKAAPLKPSKRIKIPSLVNEKRVTQGPLPSASNILSSIASRSPRLPLPRLAEVPIKIPISIGAEIHTKFELPPLTNPLANVVSNLETAAPNVVPGLALVASDAVPNMINPTIQPLYYC